MPEPTLHTTRLHACVDRFRAGDRGAADELLTAVAGRLERLARKMLGGFPDVRGAADTGDVLQGALLRLVRSLREVRPDSTRSFYNLAAVHMRRELLDLARAVRCRPAERLGDADVDLIGHADDATDLDRWTALQQAVDDLPAEQREVFGLTFYHGWAQAQVAELLQVSDRQVRRLWADACRRLDAAVGGQLPSV
jgi:RNA polymerase sigma-70 factor (ECF subfamily)